MRWRISMSAGFTSGSRRPSHRSTRKAAIWRTIASIIGKCSMNCGPSTEKQPRKARRSCFIQTIRWTTFAASRDERLPACPSEIIVIPKLSIRSYKRVSRPIRKPVTKFGGQPVWLEEPAWPISAGSATPMRFICQILLTPSLFGDGPTKMAYLFLTQAERDEIEHGAFDPDIIFPDEGENAVILQPGGRVAVETTAQKTGPTLY